MGKRFLRLSAPSLLPEDFKNAVVTIGSFDGVHRGHQLVLQYALSKAHELNKPAIVLTFEPHPRTLFNLDKPIIRLTSASEKTEIFRLIGFDAVIEQTFTREFAGYTAEMFMKNILYNTLKVNCIVTGDNFYFGYKRQGSPDLLQKVGKKLGFSVSIVDSMKDRNGEVISSSRIRILLQHGSIEESSELLGYHYTVSEKVVYGSAFGRTLGFPTANMTLSSQKNLALGIYAVRFRCPDGKIYDGVASFGHRPTVNKVAKPILETYIFDFSDNLYGKICAVFFFSFLRREKKFSDLNSLIAQMRKDEAEARVILAKAKPISRLDYNFVFKNKRL
ncbi:MAG: riboflavin kinase / FMN adenylyltransferase [Candidatus Tokpelaia sp. JSC188]|nr:MAG: riboflavin kinase / FMN adenylyltransferase [Candidatus Tokpelaia sp. JSC188]